jgi:hypothetical protein
MSQHLVGLKKQCYYREIDFTFTWNPSKCLDAMWKSLEFQHATCSFVLLLAVGEMSFASAWNTGVPITNGRFKGIPKD